MVVVADAVRETTTVVGTTAVVILSGATVQARRFSEASEFSAPPVTGVPYRIVAVDGAALANDEHEQGEGTYNVDGTFTRTAPTWHRKGGVYGAGPCDFSAGTKHVYVAVGVAADAALALAAAPVQASDPRLSDPRTPTAHAASHIVGADRIPLVDLFRYSRFGGYLAVSNVNLVPTAVGAPTWVESGNVQRNISATSLLTSLQRRGYVTTAVAGVAAGGRSQPVLLRDFGGFSFTIKFAITDASLVAGARMFAGLRAASTAPTDVQIDSIINGIGIGHEANEGFALFHNDATSVATKVALDPAKFPVVVGEVIRADFYTRAATSDIIVVLTNESTGQTQSVVANTDLPAMGVALTPTLWRGTGAATAAAGVDFFCALFDLQGGLP